MAARASKAWTRFVTNLADTIYNTITLSRNSAGKQHVGHARWEPPARPRSHQVQCSETAPAQAPLLTYLQQIWLCVHVFCAGAIRQQGQVGLGGKKEEQTSRLLKSRVLFCHLRRSGSLSRGRLPAAAATWQGGCGGRLRPHLDSPACSFANRCCAIS